jgi:hypothetical protein
MLINNSVQSSGAERLNTDQNGQATVQTTSRTLGQGANGYFGPATPVYWSQYTDVCVAIEFLGFDPSSSDATIATVVSATPYGLKTMALAGDSNGLLVVSSNFGLSTITIPFPLADLSTGDLSPACSSGTSAPYTRGVGYRSQETVYMLGQPRAFPDDWYELDDTVAVYFCTPKQAQNDCVTQLNQQGAANFLVGNGHGTSITASVIATTRDQDLTMKVATGADTLDRTIPNGVKVKFVIERSGWFVFYTYLIAVMPFILIYGLFAAYLRQTKKAKKTEKAKEKDGERLGYRPERKVPAVYEIAFGVAATLVAILPLRAVLVPSALPSLTRLDLVFGIGIASLVALSLTWVLVWSRPTPAESPGKAEGAATATNGPPGDPTQPSAAHNAQPPTTHGVMPGLACSHTAAGLRKMFTDGSACPSKLNRVMFTFGEPMPAPGSHGTPGIQSGAQ